MKKYIQKGKMDYSELKNPPEKHERTTAKYFNDRGANIKFIKPSSIKGTKSPDFEMCGKLWEVKSPLKYSDSSFEYNFRKAIKQSSHIIFDLRRLDLRDEKKYTKELKKWSNTPTIRTLMVITKDGRVLTLRGKFDNI